MRKRVIDKKLQLAVIIIAVILSSAIISHSMIAWLRIGTAFGRHWIIGAQGEASSVFVAGSSLAGDGLSWKRIGDVFKIKFEGWTVAGSSPSEWEIFQRRASDAKGTILVVSAYDLNEYFLCDFRAEVVPIRITLRDLWRLPMDWSFSRRVLSQYPLRYIRKIFPTAGRSEGVMVGVREKVKYLIRGILPMESEAGPTVSFGGDDNGKEEKIINWAGDKRLRRIASMRSGFQGMHGFKGPKKLAFLRMLRVGMEQGPVIVVVLPVSPMYGEEFMTPSVRREFEETLTEGQQAFKQSIWVRLDKIKDLNSDEYFWDLVHMNKFGQQIATDAFLQQAGSILRQG